MATVRTWRTPLAVVAVSVAILFGVGIYESVKPTPRLEVSSRPKYPMEYGIIDQAGGVPFVHIGPPTTTIITVPPVCPTDPVCAPYVFANWVHVMPPHSPTDTPRISKAQAYTVYRKLGMPDWRAESGHPVDEHYGRVTDVVFGEQQPDGRTKLAIADELMWVLRFDGVNCMVSGPPRPPGVTIPSMYQNGCIFTVLVDAITGQPSLSFDDGPVGAPG
jgi:hypothetical protein